jgi:hypothetical protein
MGEDLDKSTGTSHFLRIYKTSSIQYKCIVAVEDGENIKSTQLGQHPQQMERTFGAFSSPLSH